MKIKLLKERRFKMGKPQGIVFVSTLVVLSLVIFSSVAMFGMITNDVYILRKNVLSTQAKCLAEAGIEEILKEIHNDFDYIPTGYPKELEIGEYDVEISTHPTQTYSKLVMVTGTVGDVSETITLQVTQGLPEAFNYSSLSGGRLRIGNGATIGTLSNPVKVHSNNSLRIGDCGSEWTVNGSVSASSYITGGEYVSGEVTQYAPYVELPYFDDNFFQHYYNLASADENVYPGPYQEFTSNPCEGTENRVTYVEGDVILYGDWSMTGTLIATGNIYINPYYSVQDPEDYDQIIHIDEWNNQPVLMSKYGDVYICNATEIEGMIYAGDDVESYPDYGTVNITGSVYSRDKVYLYATNLDFKVANPPGLPRDQGELQIIYIHGG